MKAIDIIEDLISSELSSNAVAELEEIPRNAKFMRWINQALRDINLRLPLIQKEKIYNLVTDSVGGNSMTYITPNDFQGILAAYDEKGRPIPINDEYDSLSIYTPEPFKVFIPYSVEGARVSIIYQAKVPDITDVTLELPVGIQYESAITYYVAMKALAPLEPKGTPINSVYEAKYEKAISLLVSSGMYNKDSLPEVSHFERGGWK